MKLKGVERVEIRGEVISLKRSFSGWKQIFPIKKNEDKSFFAKGNIDWKNLMTGGSWWNTILVLFFVVVILGLIFEYISNVRIGAECLAREAMERNLTKFVNPSFP